jgi:hypothetical protein
LRICNKAYGITSQLQLLSNDNEIEYLKQPVAMVAERGTWSRRPVAEPHAQPSSKGARLGKG